MNFIVVDTETGGINPETDALLSIGLIATNSELKVLDSFEILIAPPPSLTITTKALMTNKVDIAKHMLTAISEAVALDGLEYFVKQYVNGTKYPPLIGWNLHFDIEFLKALYGRHYKTWPFGYMNQDVQQVWSFAQYFQLKNNKYIGGIDQASRSLLKREVKHSALEDARTTLDLLRVMNSE